MLVISEQILSTVSWWLSPLLSIPLAGLLCDAVSLCDLICLMVISCVMSVSASIEMSQIALTSLDLFLIAISSSVWSTSTQLLKGNFPFCSAVLSEVRLVPALLTPVGLVGTASSGFKIGIKLHLFRLCRTNNVVAIMKI